MYYIVYKGFDKKIKTIYNILNFYTFFVVAGVAFRGGGVDPIGWFPGGGVVEDPKKAGRTQKKRPPPHVIKNFFYHRTTDSHTDAESIQISTLALQPKKGRDIF